jgi:hypothetical protein
MNKRAIAFTLSFLITAGLVLPVFAGGGVVHATDVEPNDDFETAVAVSEGTFSGEIVNGESDFFKLNASTTEALSAEITSADDLGDLELRIYDADRTQLVGDGNDFNGINTNLKLPETGTYYVEVAGQSEGTNSSYTLDLDVVTPAENDQFAPNDDFESAAPISEGVSEARIVGGESDFYRLEANSTDAISVDMTSADSLNDLAIRLYDADRNQLVADGNDFEGIDYTLKAPETGTYYIQVLGQSTQTTSDYTLNVDVVTPAENDQFAPNDDFESAAPISEGVSEARIVGGESDFYRLEANSTDAISVDMTSADSLNDLAIRLYDADRNQLVADGNDFEGIDYTLKAPETGTYYIQVLGQSTQTTSDYTLNVDVVTPAENDQFAPNDDFESAAPLREEFNDARVVGGEADYYKVTLNESESISAEIRTADSLSDLVIRLYAPDRTQVASDGNDFDGIGVSHQATTAGTYYIEVAGQSKQTTSSYELQSNQTFRADDVTQVPQDLRRFTGRDNRIGNLDVLSAVNAANSNRQIGGEPVSNLDVLRLVNYANDN